MTSKNSTILLSIIGALTMAYYVSSAGVAYSDYLRELSEEVLKYKHTRCYYPYSIYRVPENNTNALRIEIAQRWFYYGPTKACRPLYSLPTFKYTIENKNYNLPQTQLECEALCGDFCMVNYADGKTEMGVCTELKSVSENCKNILPEIHPKQCPPMYSKCCPRDFEKLGAYLI